jgi:hypothetical protein
MIFQLAIAFSTAFAFIDIVSATGIAIPKSIAVTKASPFTYLAAFFS